MNSDYTIHSGWGNHISWVSEDFSNITEQSIFDVYGHVPIRPKVGDTLIGEFQKSFIKFVFIDVEYCLDPEDMFFAKVRPIDQEFKSLV